MRISRASTVDGMTLLRLEVNLVLLMPRSRESYTPTFWAAGSWLPSLELLGGEQHQAGQRPGQCAQERGPRLAAEEIARSVR